MVFCFVLFLIKIFSGIQQAIPRCRTMRLLFIFLNYRHNANGKESCETNCNVYHLCQIHRLTFVSAIFFQKKASDASHSQRVFCYKYIYFFKVTIIRGKQVLCLKIFKATSISYHLFHLLSKGRHQAWVGITLNKTPGKAIYMHSAFNQSLRPFVLQVYLSRDLQVYPVSMNWGQ